MLWAVILPYSSYSAYGLDDLCLSLRIRREDFSAQPKKIICMINAGPVLQWSTITWILLVKWLSAQCNCYAAKGRRLNQRFCFQVTWVQHKCMLSIIKECLHVQQNAEDYQKTAHYNTWFRCKSINMQQNTRKWIHETFLQSLSKWQSNRCTKMPEIMLV